MWHALVTFLDQSGSKFKASKMKMLTTQAPPLSTLPKPAELELEDLDLTPGKGTCERERCQPVYQAPPQGSRFDFANSPHNVDSSKHNNSPCHLGFINEVNHSRCINFSHLVYLLRCKSVPTASSFISRFWFGFAQSFFFWFFCLVLGLP